MRSLTASASKPSAARVCPRRFHASEHLGSISMHVEKSLPAAVRFPCRAPRP